MNGSRRACAGSRRLSLLLSLAITAGLAAALMPTTVVVASGDARYSIPKDKLDAALACHGGKANLDGSGRKQPVLLVHGTGVNRETNWDWNYWDALPEAGFETCWVQLPGEALVDIQISAEYVARAIQVMNRKSGEKTDVLGHSQGGLVPRWSIKWFPSGTLVGDYIGLASPNHGTETADAGTRFGQAPPAVWQLRRAAKFIAAVNRGDETPGRTHYTSIYTAADELVQPVGTQALAGGTNILLQDICPGRPVDHANIAGDGLTYLLVLDALINPGPAAVKRLPASACQEAAMPGASAPPPDSAPNYDSGRTVDREPRLKPYARR